MTTILDHIVADKIEEVKLKKMLIPTANLQTTALFNRETVSLAKSLRESTTGIIAEHKRRSPSKAEINQKLNITDVVTGYELAGASGISVLTDVKHFGGATDDIILARASTKLPILRKDFIIDAYQIYEARAIGADAILLIAAILTASEIKTFSELAKSLGLDVLLEVHNQDELEKSLMPSIDIIGVNNRNLKTFEVSLDTSKNLSKHIPDDFVKISESGIHSTSVITELKAYGFNGFLIGETFMKTNNPGKAAKAFINAL